MPSELTDLVAKIVGGSGFGIAWTDQKNGRECQED
jgi:hypothetical protein